MEKNIVFEKSKAFAIRIVKLYKYLCEIKKESTMSKQLLRCGTSIGANIAEAQRAQTRADFHAKMCIAQKEAGETEYWLQLLFETDYLTEAEYASIGADLKEIIRMLAAICKATRR